MNHPIVIYARKVLNGLLLDRAIAAGCTAVCSRVTNVNTNGPRVSLMAAGDERFSDFIVLAAGARNQLLPETTALGSKDLEVTMGYFVPTEEDIIKVKFLKQFEGYLWSFPRADHLSVGICAKMGQTSTPVLRRHLDAFFEEEKSPAQARSFTATCFLRRKPRPFAAAKSWDATGLWPETRLPRLIPSPEKDCITHCAPAICWRKLLRRVSPSFIPRNCAPLSPRIWNSPPTSPGKFSAEISWAAPSPRAWCNW